MESGAALCQSEGKKNLIDIMNDHGIEQLKKLAHWIKFSLLSQVSFKILTLWN